MGSNSEQERSVTRLVVQVALSRLEVALPLRCVVGCRAATHSFGIVKLLAYVNALADVVCRHRIVPTRRVDTWRRRWVFHPPVGRWWARGIEDVATDIVGVLVLFFHRRLLLRWLTGHALGTARDITGPMEGFCAERLQPAASWNRHFWTRKHSEVTLRIFLAEGAALFLGHSGPFPGWRIGTT